MSEILTIRNFGPIDEITVELKAVTVFIGDQGTGKSTIAKVLNAIVATYFEVNRDSSVYEPSRFLIEKDINSEKKIFLDYLLRMGILDCLIPDTIIKLESSIVLFKYVDGEIEVLRCDQDDKNQLLIPKVFIPSYREAAVLLKDSLYGIIRSGTKLPDLLSQFGQLFIDARKSRSLFDFSHILGVKYKFENEQDLIVLENDQKISLENASSAVNSLVPFLVVLDYIFWFDGEISANGRYRRDVSKFFFVEEPELNCFPFTQKKVVDHIIKLFQLQGIEHLQSTKPNFFIENKLVITTHSPYILSSLNNLLSGFEASKIDAAKTAEKFPGKVWLDPAKTSVYLLKDGIFEDIMDYEENLIKIDKIDSVSDIINSEFDDFLKIQMQMND